MIDMTSFLHSKNKNKTTTFQSLAPSRRARLEVPKAAHLPTIVVHQGGRIFGHTQRNKLPIGKGWDPTRFLWVIGLSGFWHVIDPTQAKESSLSWQLSWWACWHVSWIDKEARFPMVGLILLLPVPSGHVLWACEPLGRSKDSMQQFQRHVPRPLLHF